jgi:hypothetical protein
VAILAARVRYKSGLSERFRRLSARGRRENGLGIGTEEGEGRVGGAGTRARHTPEQRGRPRGG